MARVIIGGEGGRNYQMRGDCGDMSRDRDSLRPKPSYVSKFANKVRQDLRNRKICWSSMGLPSTLPAIDPPKPSQSTSNFLPNIGSNSLTFGSKRAPLSQIKSKPSSHTSLPYKHSRTLRLVPCPLPTQKVSKWDSYYKVKPTLVRPRKQVEFEDIDFDSIRRNSQQEDYSSGDREDTNQQQQSDCKSNNNYYEDYVPPKNLLAVEMKPKSAVANIPPTESITNAGDASVITVTQNQFQPSRNNPMILQADDMEKAMCSCHSSFKNLDKRNTRGSVPGILNPCVCSKAYEMVKKNPESIDLNNCDNQEELKKKLNNITTDQDLCDAFILQKLLEIRKRMNQNEKTPRCHNVEEYDEEDSDQLPSTCYNGDVNIIDRGQKDFILENALKCSRMQTKRGPRMNIEDWKGNGCDLGQRMVFKKDYGQVPDYILKRKEEIQMEKDLLERFEAEEANKKCRALTDEERKALTEGLSQNWEQLFLEFQNLPLFSSSQRVLKRKSEIETQLRDLESDLRLITRHGRLFVSNNQTPNAFLWS